MRLKDTFITHDSDGGRIAAAGGKVYSVDEGLLELPIL